MKDYSKEEIAKFASIWGMFLMRKAGMNESQMDEQIFVLSSYNALIGCMDDEYIQKAI